MLRSESFLYETDPDKMTPEWGDKVISRRRIDWRPVVEPATYIANKNLLLSMQSMEKVKMYFADDEDFCRNVPFEPLPIMEKPRNILIDELKKSGIKPYIKATDVAAKKDKDNDIFKLSNRNVIEGDINQNRQKIGLERVPFKMDYKEFSGNVDQFDQMGLDGNSPSDVRFFMDSHYKLNYEANAQIIVNSYLELNEVDDDIPRYVNDVLAGKVACSQDYVSPMTGQIKSLYLQPSQTYCIFGKRRDAKDAAVRGWEMQITLFQLLEQLGNAFDFARDWEQLVMALNYGNNSQYDGFIKGGITYSVYERGINTATENDRSTENERPLNLLMWDDAISSYNYKVYFGYIEWEQPYAHVEKRNTKTGQRFTVTHDFVPTEKSMYEKESWYAFKTITSNYLATGSMSQKLYGYGDLYHMLTEGQYDEYSRGSISIIREEGLPAIRVAKVYIDLANYAYYKMLWAIHRSKPDVWSFAYESIIEVAKKFKSETQGLNTPQAAGAFGDAVNNLIEMFKKKLFMMHTYPIVDGRAVGGGGNPHQKIPGQLDPLAGELRSIVLEWAEYQVMDKLGLLPRDAGGANPKEGLKLTEIYLKQSRSATGYIPEMIEKIFEHKAKITLLYAQDIIKHKASVPYKFLVNLVGKEVLVSVEELDKFASHRFGLFINSMSVQAMKEKLDTQAEFAMQQGQITFAEYTLIINMTDPRSAAIQLAYMKEKARKQQQQDAMQLEAQRQQTVQMQIKGQMDIINLQGTWRLREAQIPAQATLQGKQLDYQGKIETTQMKIEAEPPKQAAKAAKEQEVLETQAALENQKPFQEVA